MTATPSFRTEEERQITLSAIEEQRILKIDLSFETIKAAVYFDNYDLPCPVKLSLAKKDGGSVSVVLRKSRHGDINKEVQIFRALKEYGLPVPDVLVEPFRAEDGEYAAVYSLLPGEDLQKLSMRSPAGLELSKKLLVDAVVRLIDATGFIKNHAVGRSLPEVTLASELEAVNVPNNPWYQSELFRSAIARLQPVIEDARTTLVFTNGDYQPGNFLTENGVITGYLDFENPSFQDPLMGFVKYPIYDLLPLGRTNIVQVFLDRMGYSEQDFRCRLALGCLKTLQREIPVSGGDEETEQYRARVLALLQKSV